MPSCEPEDLRDELVAPLRARSTRGREDFSTAATASRRCSPGALVQPCDRFLSPSTVRTDGTCPTCGWTVDAGEVAANAAAERSEPKPEPPPEPAEEELAPIPWHLKLLAAAILVYLLFRAYQGIEWLIG